MLTVARAPKAKPVVVARDGCEDADENAYGGAVREMLRAVNGAASAHAITTYREVLDVCRAVERMFARRGLPKSRRGPCWVDYRPAGPEAASYGFRVVTTSIALDRTKGGVWKLVSAVRDHASPRQGRRLCVTVTAEMCREIAERAIEPFWVGGASPGMLFTKGLLGSYKAWFPIPVPKVEDSREDMNRWCHDNLAAGFWIEWGHPRACGWFEDQTDAGLFRLKYDTGG